MVKQKTIYFQPGTSKMMRLMRTDDLTEVGLGQFYCTG